jgi:hypothetical protein
MALSYPLATGFFKTKDDGSRVFFPWGFWGRGYIITSDKEFERLHEQMSAWFTVLSLLGMPVIVWIMAFETGWMKFYISTILMLCFISGYAAWAGIQCYRLESTHERLGLDEWAHNAAWKWSEANLWLFEIIFVVGILLSVFGVALKPESTRGFIVLAVYSMFGAVACGLILRAKKQQESQPVQS